MSAKRDYSKYDPQQVLKIAKMNMKAELYDYIQCPICGKKSEKAWFTRVLCGKWDCRNIFHGLQKYGYMEKIELKKGVRKK
jgi:ribosomal protein L37AE/L43A